MLDLLNEWGLQGIKPLIPALVLPPVPLILAVWVGALMLPTRRAWGRAFIGLSCACLWLTHTVGWSDLLARWATTIPEALTHERINELGQQTIPSAIVVLGSGVEDYAPEYGTANLTELSLERLRYAISLSRSTHLPIAFSGGAGWASRQNVTEAETARRIASSEFRAAIQWIDSTSRDTHENAVNTIQMLKKDGIRHIILVTHGWHMRRAAHLFKKQVQHQSALISIETAPMGLGEVSTWPVLRWLPSSEGATRSRRLTLEIIGQIFGRY
ncbi:MAG: YdcF family protein [Burkholderiales bacterium]